MSIEQENANSDSATVQASIPMAMTTSVADNVVLVRRRNGLRLILADDGDLQHLTDECLAALTDHQADLGLYRQAGRLVRVEISTDGRPNIEPMTPDRLRHALARSAYFFKVRNGEEKPAHPPKAAAQDVLAMPEPPFPVLDAVVSTPFITPDGQLATRAGYYSSCRVLQAPSGDAEIPAIDTSPSAEQIAKAKSLLLNELLGEFPFETASDMAHTLLTLVTPFIRYLVCGPVPLFVMTKHDPGTGAGLIVELVSRISIGTGVAVMTEGSNDEETRKRITAKLRSSPRIVVIDNLRRPLDSSALAAALTTEIWEDRVIGSSNMTRQSTRGVTWIATGNNVRTSIELARRSVLIGMNARMAQPWLRSGFRHSDLSGWVTANLGQLRWALLTLVQAWLAAGRPTAPGKPRLGSFEAWCDVAGGILATAGIPGFLENRDQMYAASDPEGESLRRFVAAWQTTHGTAHVGAADLFALAEAANVDLGRSTDRSRQTRLGILLRGMTQRRFLTPDGRTLTVTAAGEGTGNQSGAKLWTLVEPNVTATTTEAPLPED